MLSRKKSTAVFLVGWFVDLDPKFAPAPMQQFDYRLVSDYSLVMENVR
jgi:hypothetical protein